MKDALKTAGWNSLLNNRYPMALLGLKLQLGFVAIGVITLILLDNIGQEFTRLFKCTAKQDLKRSN